MSENDRKPFIRPVTLSDAQELLNIYAYYVKNTAVTFECDVPSIDEFTSRIKHISENYPYLVAESDGKIVGYACAHPFVGRSAYSHSAETTIYIAPDERRSGAGKALYTALEAVSKQQNIINLYACIAFLPEDSSDPYLTSDSVDFHAHFGYRIVGEFYKCGFKFNNWYTMVWMEKRLGKHETNPPAMIPFPKLDAETLADCGIQL